MKQIIAVKREGRDISEKAEWIDVEDINYTEPERIRGEIKTVIYTDHGEYIYCTSNDLILSLLQQESGFFISDRGRIANLNKEIEIDHKQRKILYNKRTNFVTIAASKFKALLEYLEKLKK